MTTRLSGGSGFTVAATLRHFFLEYFDRFHKYGPHSFPTSFNVIESFLKFSKRYFAFDIREEREHLLCLNDYLDWYTAGSYPDNPATLCDILPEGIAYCFNTVAPLQDFPIEAPGSILRILGLALIRHNTELSLMVIAGETPPHPKDDEITLETDGEPVEGRAMLKPDPSYTVESRYIPEMHGHARVIALTRFDLERSRYDVRYINLDIGKAYFVLSDDPRIMGHNTVPLSADTMQERLEAVSRYDSLFSAAASLMYLPAFFIDQHSRVAETK
jgi:hypothetical protein